VIRSGSLRKVQLFCQENDILRRRNKGISYSILSQVPDKMKIYPNNLLKILCDSTDVENPAQRVVYETDANNLDIQIDFLFRESLEDTTVRDVCKR
jgi:hypothetical protein